MLTRELYRTRSRRSALSADAQVTVATPGRCRRPRSWPRRGRCGRGRELGRGVEAVRVDRAGRRLLNAPDDAGARGTRHVGRELLLLAEAHAAARRDDRPRRLQRSRELARDGAALSAASCW
jgi:hypothetical protein